MLVTVAETIFAPIVQKKAFAGRIYRSIGLKRLKEIEKFRRTSALIVSLMLQEEQDITVHSKKFVEYSNRRDTIISRVIMCTITFRYVSFKSDLR